MTPTTPGSWLIAGTSVDGTRAENPPMIGRSWVIRPPIWTTAARAPAVPWTMTLLKGTLLDGACGEPVGIPNRDSAAAAAARIAARGRRRTDSVIETLRERLVTKG